MVIQISPILHKTINTSYYVILCAVDFRELLNVTSGDLSVAHGLNLTDLYRLATQNQSVFLQEYVARTVSLITLH